MKSISWFLAISGCLVLSGCGGGGGGGGGPTAPPPPADRISIIVRPSNCGTTQTGQGEVVNLTAEIEVSSTHADGRVALNVYRNNDPGVFPPLTFVGGSFPSIHVGITTNQRLTVTAAARATNGRIDVIEPTLDNGPRTMSYIQGPRVPCPITVN